MPAPHRLSPGSRSSAQGSAGPGRDAGPMLTSADGREERSQRGCSSLSAAPQHRGGGVWSIVVVAEAVTTTSAGKGLEAALLAWEVGGCSQPPSYPNPASYQP